MATRLRNVTVPEFGVPDAIPFVPSLTFSRRCADAYNKAQCDWLIVYADREHLANMVYLSGFEPRFEESLLLIGSGGRRILIVGNEGEGYASVATLPDLEVQVAQSMSLMGQDRSNSPNLERVLSDAGLKAGQKFGLVGWKYFEAREWAGASQGFFLPHYLVAILARIAGGPNSLVDATAVLMHPTEGLRSQIDADGIALHEWGASRASSAVWRIVNATRPGISEFHAVAAMSYAGEVLSAHVMYATGNSTEPVIGMRSPSARIIRLGDGVTTAVGYWGGLSSRAGLVADGDDAFLQVAAAYFEGLVAWYEVADIGVSGGDIFASVTAALARNGLRSTLNPGHLTGHDEWIHTPVRPGSDECIASGMPFQVDIIPTPMPAGFALNCEDGIVFADQRLRTDLRTRHPAVFDRIEARRSFMRDELGVALKDSILPLSSTPLCLPPFWMAPQGLLVRA
jgi:hypothetical protein